jgi:benzoyl-CoA reductase/2-hydroxyglutaryl-CoA dehydratase subunit BcrC/BadD/HgdB
VAFGGLKGYTSSGTEGDRMQSATMTSTLQHLSAIAATLENDEVRKWKKQGGKVIGYLCSTIPEEMSI